MGFRRLGLQPCRQTQPRRRYLLLGVCLLVSDAVPCGTSTSWWCAAGTINGPSLERLILIHESHHFTWPWNCVTTCCSCWTKMAPHSPEFGQLCSCVLVVSELFLLAQVHIRRRDVGTKLEEEGAQAGHCHHAQRRTTAAHGRPHPGGAGG